MCVNAHGMYAAAYETCIYIQDMYNICFLFFPACSSRWCLLDLNKLDTLLESVDCPHCQSEQSLRTSTSDAKRMGFALCLELSCCKCGFNFGNTYSSPELPSDKKPSPFLINDLMTLIFQPFGARTYCHGRVLWYTRDACHASENFPE